MNKAICQLSSVSPYSPSRPHTTPKKEKESADAYEKRTWRERCHVDSEGFIVIPPMSIKNCLANAAQYLGEKIIGKGKSTYTKHFKAGLLVTDPIRLPIRKEEVLNEEIFVPSDGRPGGGSRVWKTFPLIPNWKGSVEVWILDPVITEAVFADHLKQAGQFIGLGRFRPQNGGIYGRFTVESIEWIEDVSV